MKRYMIMPVAFGLVVGMWALTAAEVDTSAAPPAAERPQVAAPAEQGAQAMTAPQDAGSRREDAADVKRDFARIVCNTRLSAAHVARVMDRDSDGLVTRGELDRFSDMIMAASDDRGYVTVDEVTAAAGDDALKRLQSGFMRSFDRDGDGMVTKAEAPSACPDIAALDMDGDGGVSAPDFQALSQRACEVAGADTQREAQEAIDSRGADMSGEAFGGASPRWYGAAFRLAAAGGGGGTGGSGGAGGGAAGGTSGGAAGATSGGAAGPTTGGAAGPTTGGAAGDTMGGATGDTTGGATDSLLGSATGGTRGGAAGPTRGGAGVAPGVTGAAGEPASPSDAIGAGDPFDVGTPGGVAAPPVMGTEGGRGEDVLIPEIYEDIWFEDPVLPDDWRGGLYDYRWGDDELGGSYDVFGGEGGMYYWGDEDEAGLSNIYGTEEYGLGERDSMRGAGRPRLGERDTSRYDRFGEQAVEYEWRTDFDDQDR